MDGCIQISDVAFRAGRVGAPDLVRTRSDDEPRPSQPDAKLAQVQVDLAQQVLGAIRKSLSVTGRDDALDGAVDELLEMDWLFRALLNLPKSPPQQSHLAALAKYAGTECVSTVRMVMVETGRAYLGLEQEMQKRPLDAEAITAAIKDPERLFMPSRYLGAPDLPAEVQRAFLGRDFAQLMLVGLVCGPSWGLARERVLELCDRFRRHQAYWIEFVNVAQVDINPAALPKERTDFQEAYARNRRANEQIEAAAKHLDSTGEAVYFMK